MCPVVNASTDDSITCDAAVKDMNQKSFVCIFAHHRTDTTLNTETGMILPVTVRLFGYRGRLSLGKRESRGSKEQMLY